MNAKVSISLPVGANFVTATFDGPSIARHWNDPFLKKVVSDACNNITSSPDTFDFASLVFSYVFNAINRRWNGAVNLYSVEVIAEDRTVTSYS
jgi:hypothetical protein